MLVFLQDGKGTGWAGGQIHSESWEYARGQKPGSTFFYQVQKHRHPKFRIWVEQVRARSKEERKVGALRRLLPMGLGALSALLSAGFHVDNPIWLKTPAARLKMDCLYRKTWITLLVNI